MDLDVVNTASHFDWPEVAKIAGGVSISLLGIIGGMIGYLLKRQGMIPELKLAVDKMSEKLTNEINDRRYSVDHAISTFNKELSEERAFSKEVIKDISDKLEKNTQQIIANFKSQCTLTQAACSGAMAKDLEHFGNRLELNCSKIAAIQRQRQDKWKEQDKLNLQFTRGLNNHK